MNPRTIVLGTAGLALLVLAAWMVPLPRRAPRPDCPEIAPFAAGERIALVVPDPESFPAPDAFGLVQRARAAGAEMRIFAAAADFGGFAPDRAYQASAEPETSAGYHPDQWPTSPPGEGWQMLVLTPEEQTVKNRAALAAARALRASGTDDAAGTREAALLARARRAECYRSLKK